MVIYQNLPINRLTVYVNRRQLLLITPPANHDAYRILSARRPAPKAVGCTLCWAGTWRLARYCRNTYFHHELVLALHASNNF